MLVLLTGTAVKAVVFLAITEDAVQNGLSELPNLLRDLLRRLLTGKTLEHLLAVLLERFGYRMRGFHVGCSGWGNDHRIRSTRIALVIVVIIVIFVVLVLVLVPIIVDPTAIVAILAIILIVTTAIVTTAIVTIVAIVARCHHGRIVVLVPTPIRLARPPVLFRTQGHTFGSAPTAIIAHPPSLLRAPQPAVSVARDLDELQIVPANDVL
jgi:hypothetical protein